MGNRRIAGFIDGLLSQGRFTFTLEEACRGLDCGDSALKATLYRSVRKGSIVSVRKGLYVVVPPEYRVRGMLPPVLFADDLMRYLNRPYYAALLTAAALHGAAHQQPQEFFMVTPFPAVRDICTKGIAIRFVTKRRMPETGVEDMKTDTGIVKISTPELTAIDLVAFGKRIGGLNRAVEVLAELIDRVAPNALADVAKTNTAVSVTQRLGYLAEEVLDRQAVADALFEVLEERDFFPVPLVPGKVSDHNHNPNRWKVNVNEAVELDL